MREQFWDNHKVKLGRKPSKTNGIKLGEMASGLWVSPGASGEVVLNSIDSIITQFSGAGGLVNVDNTIRGSGTISSVVENQGTILADSSAGSLFFNDTLTLEDSSVLAVLFDGVSFADSGTFDVNSILDLNGTLQLIAGDDFDAEIGDTFTFLAVDGLTTGTDFDVIDQSLTGRFAFDVIVDDAAGTVSVGVVSVSVSVPEPSTLTCLTFSMLIIVSRRRRLAK